MTLDDATNVIYSATLVTDEGTASTFAGLLEVFTAYDLPCSLYTGHGSHCFHTPKAGGAVDRATATAYLWTTCVAEHNVRFAVAAE